MILKIQSHLHKMIIKYLTKMLTIGHVSLAGAFASYYWVFNKPNDVPYFAVIGGFYRCIRSRIILISNILSKKTKI